MPSRFLTIGSLFITALPAAAQQGTAGSGAVKIGNVTISGSLRTRAEIWDWFQGNGNNQYAFSESLFRLSFSQSREDFDWKLELAAPVLLGIPSNAVAPGSQGQLGFGGTYYVANGKAQDAAMIFPKQGYVRFRYSNGAWKQSIQIGRTEFKDGAEVTPRNATLATLARDRIAERLIGTFGFSDVGRSFDGLLYTADHAGTNVTILAARPTRGVFQVDGWGEINTNLFYGAVTQQTGTGSHAGEWRVFAIGYNDYRNGVLKTDNRAQALRAADQSPINIATVGANYIGAMKTPAGTLDVVLWGALQGGSWGVLAQRAEAYALEAGWQPPVLDKIKPWIRGGYNYGSGDRNPKDGTHGTFFQILPTPRVYARFPFFNMMNIRDAFGELMLRPSKALTIRADVHALALANANDLWYSGGGAYQPWTFGYTGRPSNGYSGFANLYDGSADYTLNVHFAFGAYYGRATGHLVTEAIYPAGKNANLGLLELNTRF